MGTPHIEAKKEDIGEVVLMPGDPLRAKFIADNYLSKVKKINGVRNMLGYTGYYQDKRVTVMGSGMGIPSMGIYSYELFHFYNVQKIIRIGSCGAFTKDLKLYDLILVENSYSDSTYAYVQNGSTKDLLPASITLNNKLEEIAKKNGIKIKKGNIYTTDVFTFYQDKKIESKQINKYNCLASEMETFALFHNAQVLGKEAASVLTVVDNILTKEKVSFEKREQGLHLMIELVLKSL